MAGAGDDDHHDHYDDQPEADAVPEAEAAQQRTHG
jgi:hypothetical protein